MNEQTAFYVLRKQVEAFTKITEADWEMLLPFLEVKHLRKSELFIQEGKRANEIGLVMEGMLRQYYTKDGEEKTTYFFFENHFISSYISCITAQPSLITIEALSDSTFISFPYKIMLELFDKKHGMAKIREAHC